MFTAIKSAFLAFLTFFMMIYGTFAGTNNSDTISAYKKNVKSVKVFENTMEDARPQTDIYKIISDHVNAPLPEGKTEKKVIVLGYDGCRADTFTLFDAQKPSAISTVLNDGGKAYLSYCGGKNYPDFNTQATSTAPGWCSMLTGEWANVTGVTDNSIPKSNDHLSLLTTLVESEKIDSSAFYVSWGGHFSGEDATYINEKNYIEEKGINSTFLKANDDNGTYANVMNDVQKDDCSDFIFSIFEYCDHTGHDNGFGVGNEDYVKAFYDAEEHCNNIISAIKARADYETEDWLIIVTSDHGGYNTGHGAFTMQERYTFIVANKDI